MNKRSGKYYRNNEKEVAKEMGARPTYNSGSGWVEKEDFASEDTLYQLKSTDKQSITIQKLDLDKLKLHAIQEHKTPAFVIQFLSDDTKWVMVPVK